MQLDTQAQAAAFLDIILVYSAKQLLQQTFFARRFILESACRSGIKGFTGSADMPYTEPCVTLLAQVVPVTVGR